MPAGRLAQYWVRTENNSISGLDLKNNSVGTADIQNNSLTTADFKNGALLGVDLKKDSLTGTQINEGTLAKVPAATAAAAVKRVSLRLNAGDPDVTVAEHGSIKIYARCSSTGVGGSDMFALYAATTADGAVLLGDTDWLDGAPYLDATTVETDREVYTGSTSTGTQSSDTGYDATGIVYSADGSKVITFLEGSGGTMFNYFGKTCAFDAAFLLNS